MPIYEYICKDCGSHFDTMKPMKEADAPAACLDCNSQNTVRQLSVFVAKSGNRTVAGSSCGCGNCSGGSCGSCQNN
jgi:putative FmdB family regulatory protein